ncbi:hypothetical protein L1887_16958 [Cichorium endivia]|nr:hypothetical protein L1887_16958 [Cichorium endivia]
MDDETSQLELYEFRGSRQYWHNDQAYRLGDNPYWSCNLVTGSSPLSLSLGFPEAPFWSFVRLSGRVFITYCSVI